MELRPFVVKLSKISTALNWFPRNYISLIDIAFAGMHE